MLKIGDIPFIVIGVIILLHFYDFNTYLYDLMLGCMAGIMTYNIGMMTHHVLRLPRMFTEMLASGNKDLLEAYVDLVFTAFATNTHLKHMIIVGLVLYTMEMALRTEMWIYPLSISIIILYLIVYWVRAVMVLKYLRAVNINP